MLIGWSAGWVSWCRMRTLRPAMAAAEKTVVFTSTTRTAISGYTADIGLYKDEDCFESLELGGCDVVITIGTGDVTKEENLVKALEEIRDADDDFYFVLTDVTDEDCVTALCKWAEGTEPTEAALGAGVEDHRKFYFGQVTNKEYVNNYGRSAVVYTDDPSEWADAAWVGSVGPFWPESVTWKWKVPDGISVAYLRDSERDTLEENIRLRGLSLNLIDTAGIRETDDQIERMGVERSLAAAQEADLALFVVDGSKPFSAEDQEAMDAAFSREERVTLVGSTMPAGIMSTYSSV